MSIAELQRLKTLEAQVAELLKRVAALEVLRTNTYSNTLTLKKTPQNPQKGPGT